jgi:hypothetical protein
MDMAIVDQQQLMGYVDVLCVVSDRAGGLAEDERNIQMSIYGIKASADSS